LSLPSTRHVPDCQALAPYSISKSSAQHKVLHLDLSPTLFVSHSETQGRSSVLSGTRYFDTTHTGMCTMISWCLRAVGDCKTCQYIHFGHQRSSEILDGVLSFLLLRCQDLIMSVTRTTCHHLFYHQEGSSASHSTAMQRQNISYLDWALL
jgi:hypothetical protein